MAWQGVRYLRCAARCWTAAYFKVRLVPQRWRRLDLELLAKPSRKHSDIDLALDEGSDLDLDVLGRIMDDLLLPYGFDLSILSMLTDPGVLDHIRRAGVVFYQKENSRKGEQ